MSAKVPPRTPQYNYYYKLDGIHYIVEPLEEFEESMGVIILGFARNTETLIAPKMKYNVLLPGTKLTIANCHLNPISLQLVYPSIETFCNHNAWLWEQKGDVLQANRWFEYGKLFLPEVKNDTQTK